MPLVSPFSQVISNPLVIASLATNAAGNIAAGLRESQQQAQQDAITRSLAAGQPETMRPGGPVRSLLSYISGGRIPSEVAVDPTTQSMEKLALQDRQMKALSSLGALRQAFGPGIAQAPGISDLIRTAGYSPEALAAPTLPEQNEAQTEAWRKTTEQRLEQAQKGTQEYRQESLQQRQQAEKDRQQATRDRLALQQSIAASTEESRKATQRIEQERSEDQRRATFDRETAKLESDQKAVSGMLSTASPADKATVQTLFDSLNQRGERLKATADKYGYDYTPQPLTVGAKKTWGGLSSTPVIQPKDPLIGVATTQPEGSKWEIGGKRYAVKAGKIAPLDEGGATSGR